jgi:hypothetical protein
LIEFSLEEGIKREYHSFIKPKRIPPGYTATCMDTSKQYHQIPLNFDKANSNYSQIYSEIVDFLKPTIDNNFYTPLFCLNADIEDTRNALQVLRKEDLTGKQPRLVFKLWVFILFLKIR